MARSARQMAYGAPDDGKGFSLFPLALALVLVSALALPIVALVMGDARDAAPQARIALKPDEFKTEASPSGEAPAYPMTPSEAFAGDGSPPLPRTSMPIFPEGGPSAGTPDGEAPEAAPAGAPGSSDAAPAAVPAPVPAPLPPGALAPVPDPALVFYGRHGPLPVIAPDGRKAREVYARPFAAGDSRPRIAIIVGGLGLSRTMTERAIKSLPPGITLSFTPYAKDLQLLINAARAAGHEVILELPMEPFDYPHNDPGPYTLLTQADTDENMDKLEWILSRFTGYAGVVSDQGDKMLGSIEDLRPILNALNDRGLYFVDPGQSKRSLVGRLAHEVGLAWTLATGAVDKPASRNGIDANLYQLEETARGKGSAVGTGFSYPMTIERIAAWAATLDGKGLVLAPVSAVVTVPQREPSG